MECDRVLSEVEVSLGLDPNLVSERVRNVSMPLSHPGMPVIDGATRHRYRRVKLDLGIAIREICLYVAGIECLVRAAMELDVLFGHRGVELSRIPDAVGDLD